MDSEGAYWMGVDKLPEKYGEGSFPSSLRKISFQGIVSVLWHSHTQLMLRELDRNYAKTPPISPDYTMVSHVVRIISRTT
ncbi:unnamed protein product [Darwinula stevensoni]|uniref:Uncharacterized protein n=1 Tax=Darwinula stevensoni TaxID=69355 RepID=A0A7R9AF19_9CRUS|nr:unnamed protein product [Darwinula stevensoni]CAG0902871.1 unnamed protein product [Darwinula stevensoni]